ncbi:GNAT family N-acetyltransferase [Kiloniella sp.]|uniref:GNAT family N-acetyltransferase n=1 Tax=Kiloniella sp. TaxID=1938587 RepID=UPI003A8F66E1
MLIDILRATPEHAVKVSEVFDLYRQHYGELSDVETSESFLRDRIKANEAVIFFAQDSSGKAVGFALAYPIFCAALFKCDLFLGDFFVCEDLRGRGVGRKLLQAVKEHAIQINSKGTLLATELDNLKAQELYESLGFKHDTDRRYYYLSL